MQARPQEVRYRFQPHVIVPEFLRGQGWVDASDMGDFCGRSELKLVPGQGFPLLRFWVDTTSSLFREDEETPRFKLEFFPNAETESTSGGQEIFVGEDEDGARAALVGFLAGWVQHSVVRQLLQPAAMLHLPDSMG